MTGMKMETENLVRNISFFGGKSGIRTDLMRYEKNPRLGRGFLMIGMPLLTSSR